MSCVGLAACIGVAEQSEGTDGFRDPAEQLICLDLLPNLQPTLLMAL